MRHLFFKKKCDLIFKKQNQGFWGCFCLPGPSSLYCDLNDLFSTSIATLQPSRGRDLRCCSDLCVANRDSLRFILFSFLFFFSSLLFMFFLTSSILIFQAMVQGSAFLFQFVATELTAMPFCFCLYFLRKEFILPYFYFFPTQYSFILINIIFICPYKVNSMVFDGNKKDIRVSLLEFQLLLNYLMND